MKFRIGSVAIVLVAFMLSVTSIWAQDDELWYETFAYRITAVHETSSGYYSIDASNGNYGILADLDSCGAPAINQDAFTLIIHYPTH